MVGSGSVCLECRESVLRKLLLANSNQYDYFRNSMYLLATNSLIVNPQVRS